MKKIYLYLCIVVILSSLSCTKSDGNDSSKAISAKINGATKYFKDIIVTVDVYPDYTDYIITAKQNDDDTKTISISMEKGVTGTECVYYMQYFDGLNYYDATSTNFNANISENSDLKIIGTFNADLNDGNGTIVQMTQGIITINF